jgi:hypothetical protein
MKYWPSSRKCAIKILLMNWTWNTDLISRESTERICRTSMQAAALRLTTLIRKYIYSPAGWHFQLSALSSSWVWKFDRPWLTQPHCGFKSKEDAQHRWEARQLNQLSKIYGWQRWESWKRSISALLSSLTVYFTNLSGKLHRVAKK